MLSKPLVSIVIPCYNHESYVQECIRSVINQDYDNIELIIIDDGSTDSSVIRIREMAIACTERFARFSFVARENRGLCATLNEALEWSKGSYFSAIASDDVMLPQKTSVLLNHLVGESKVSGVFCGAYILDEDSNILGVRRPPERVYSFKDILLIKSKIMAPTQLLQTDSLRAIGGYPENIYIEDWYMWLALSEKGHKLKVVDGLLVGYRQHEKNSSKNALKMYEARKDVLNFFKDQPLMDRALASVALLASIDSTSTSKLQSAKYLLEGIRCSKQILFTSLFAKCLLRIIVPRAFILQLKKVGQFGLLPVAQPPNLQAMLDPKTVPGKTMEV